MEIGNKFAKIMIKWTFFIIMLVSAYFLSFSNFSNKTIKAAVINAMDSYERAYTENVTIDICDGDKPLFLAIMEQEKNWSEQKKLYVRKK